MKKIYTLFLTLTITGCLMAQTPQSFKYQAVARDAGGDIIANQAVGMQINILQGSITGTAVYVETFTPTTNEFGLINLNIGEGTVVSGDFTTIDWSSDTYFLKVEMDISGGTTYEEYGTSQLLSVPYALHAKTAENLTGTELAIGDSYGGGIIFWLDASGQHGLIAATTDQSTGIRWYNGSYTNTTAFASSVGGGDGNTSMIVFNQGTGTYAAKLCYDLNTGGYTDWYLPSKYELNLMYMNIGQGNLLGLGNVGGFASDHYWSSTEYNNYHVWSHRFSDAVQYHNHKLGTFYVRAVRAF